MPPDPPSYAGPRILLQSDFKLDLPLRHLYLQWMRAETDSRCTNVAVYSLECPPVIHTTTPGRPKLDILDVLIQLRSFGFTWKNISEMLLVSRWTIRRRVVEYGIQEITGYSSITDEEFRITGGHSRE